MATHVLHLLHLHLLHLHLLHLHLLHLHLLLQCLLLCLLQRLLPRQLPLCLRKHHHLLPLRECLGQLHCRSLAKQQQQPPQRLQYP
jgi:hypothetical protein